MFDIKGALILRSHQSYFGGFLTGLPARIWVQPGLFSSLAASVIYLERVYSTNVY